MFCTILATIGAAVLVYLVYQLFKSVFIYFILNRFISERKNLKKAGEWAIITGATAGIGEAFAERLANDGLNILLISRSKNLLENLAIKIRKNYNVLVCIYVADFYKTDFYDELQSEINKLSSVSCLINNVGVSYQYPDRLYDSEHLTPVDLTNMITCNNVSLACMSRIVLPKMLEHPPAKGVHRFIVNLGSYSGLFPTPYLTVYSACKAFALRFTQSLMHELADTCVRVQLITPSFVATKMSGIHRVSNAVPSPDTYANSALDMLGVETIGCGYFNHAFHLAFIMLVPECIRSSSISARMLLGRKKRMVAKAKSN